MSPFCFNRYQELEAHYGKLDPLANVTMDASDNASITVTFEDKTHLRVVNVKWTVEELKKSFSDIVSDAQLKNSKMQLLYDDVGAPYGYQELTFSKRNLYAHKIKEGDGIIIMLVPKIVKKL